MIGRRRSEARAIALEVAYRLRDASLRERAQAQLYNGTSFPELARPEPLSVAHGDAGLALTFSYFDAAFPGAGWDEAAHAALSDAVVAAGGRETTISLFGGLAGVGLAASLLARGGGRYRGLLDSVDEAVSAEVMRRLSLPIKPGLPPRVFDVISGWSGVVSYLLFRPTEPRVVAAAVKRLIEISKISNGIPRWFTPAQLLHDRHQARACPGGCVNLGLAHGGPGILAALALGLAAGVEVPRLRASVKATAELLIGAALMDEFGKGWGTELAVQPDGSLAPTSGRLARAGWCYGAPGVASALWLAGDSLGEHRLREEAVAAMRAVHARPREGRGLAGPTFCHGIAGLLATTLRFASRTRDPYLVNAAVALVDELISAYEPHSVLGFRSVEPDGRAVEHPGVLDGAAGVALVLLAASSGAEPAWDRLFMLS